MNKILSPNLSVLGVTMTVPLIAVIYAAAVPMWTSSVTFIILTLVAMGATAVILNTWRNAQPTENIGHVLRRAEVAAHQTAFVRPSNDRRAPEGERP